MSHTEKLQENEMMRASMKNEQRKRKGASPEREVVASKFSFRVQERSDREKLHFCPEAMLSTFKFQARRVCTRRAPRSAPSRLFPLQASRHRLSVTSYPARIAMGVKIIVPASDSFQSHQVRRFHGTLQSTDGLRAQGGRPLSYLEYIWIRSWLRGSSSSRGATSKVLFATARFHEWRRRQTPAISSAHSRSWRRLEGVLTGVTTHEQPSFENQRLHIVVRDYFFLVPARR